MGTGARAAAAGGVTPQGVWPRFTFTHMSGQLNLWAEMPRPLKIALIASLLLITFALACFFVWFGIVQGLALSEDPAKWGQFGGFFGGLANPTLSFFAFLAILAALVYQIHQLREVRMERERAIEELRLSRRAAEHYEENGLWPFRLIL